MMVVQEQRGFERLLAALKVNETSLNGRYVFRNVLNVTRSACILCCLDSKAEPESAHEVVAIKVLRQDLWDLGVQEFQSMMEIKGNLVARNCVVEAFEMFSYHGHLCIVLELLGECLHDLTRIHSGGHGLTSIDDVRKISIDTLIAISLFHRRQKIHADVKPGNLALNRTKSHMKLLDFGNAMDFKDTSMYFDKFEVQTLRYRAPEVIFGLPFGPEIDIWSLGLTVLETCLGCPLFTATTPNGLADQWKVCFGKTICFQSFQHGKYFKQRYGHDRCCCTRCGKNILTSNANRRRRNSTDIFIHHHNKEDMMDGENVSQVSNVGIIYSNNNDNEKMWDKGVLKDEETKRNDQLPFAMEELDSIKHRVRTLLRNTSPPAFCEHEMFVDFISRMLIFNPKHRMNTRDALSHPFLGTKDIHLACK